MIRSAVVALLLCESPLVAAAERNAGEASTESNRDSGVVALIEMTNRPAGVTPEEWEDALARYRIKLERNAPVQFFGKVVDQNMEPLGGVRVTGFVRSYDDAYLEKFAAGASDQKEHEWAELTDDNGNFAVHGVRGVSLHIRQFDKHGYVAPVHDEYFRISEKHFRSGVHKALPDQPVVFKMWARDAAGVAPFRRDITIDGRADGTEYRVNLETGARVDRDSEAFDVGIKIDAATNDAGRDGRYDWSYSLSSADGGFAATDDPYPFQAPEDGYASPFIAEYRRANSAWSRSAKRRFYVRSRGGALYAAIDVTVYVYRNGKALVRIGSVANSGGSRNLMTL